MATPEGLPYQQRLNDLLAVYRQAQRTIAAQVVGALRSGDLELARRRRLQLSAVLSTLDQLGAETDPIARELVADAYRQGSERALTQINALQIVAPEIPGVYPGVENEAIQALQDTILGRLRLSRETVGRTVDDVYAQAGRRAAIRAILGADGSPRSARRQLVTDLMRDRTIARQVANGGAGFIDRAGKRWALDTYAQMASRTVTREAVVQGSVARMAAHGIDLARVSVHAGSCIICQPFEGRLISLSGDTTSYEGEAVMDSSRLPPYHPNCAHSLAPVAVRIEQIRREMQAA